jgi:hypothetical protein
VSPSDEGAAVGDRDGMRVGSTAGAMVGECVLPLFVGASDRLCDGASLGALVGQADGIALGPPPLDGDLVGLPEGETPESPVGDRVGAAVG